MRCRATVLMWLSLAAALVGCGGGSGSDSKDDPGGSGPPVLSRPATEDEQEQAAQELGFPGFATKNTTRVAGADPVANAAGVALAVYPSVSPDSRPEAVTVVDAGDWRAAISASQLASLPVRAPVLFSEDGDLPAASADALEALGPTGVRRLAGAQVLRIGDAAPAAGAALKSESVAGTGAAALARGIDALHARASGSRVRQVIVAPADEPAFAMPAAGLSARSGAPVLWTGRDALPAATAAAIRTRRSARIYVVGPESAVSAAVLRRLERLGTVKRIAGDDPVANAIAVARFSDGSFGWNVVDPGHGVAFASAGRTADAAAAAPLATAGNFAPLLLVSEPGALPAAVQSFLLDIQPGYDKDPVRGVYNHGWLLGDERAISVPVQARIDALLEIQPVGR